MTLLWCALAAFVASAVNAFAGGGTFLTFPTLTGIAGLSERIANMTSTVGIWPGSAASVYAARKEIACVPRGLLVAYGIISIIGGLCGSLLLLYTSDRSFKLAVPWLLLFATLIFACSKPIARWSGRHHGGRSLGWEILVGFIQFAIAVYGGYFGAGAGVLMLAGLSFVGIDNIHQLNALKALLGTLINGVAVVIFLFGPIDYPIALAMAGSAAIGGFVGMNLARRVPQQKLRMIILAVGALLTAVYFYKAYFAGA